ncbi:RNA polymerase sigma factor [Agathobacter sp.]|uniref:RNA polymerase sigma factor n=1 Tax=Agathobacter sp. TaxID=2021311 RepID=UPI0025867F88|nr:sigma-70 family RNA polymerase sigma factor [Agathobacter sp.]
MNDEIFFVRIEQMRGKLYRIAYPYFNSESMAVDMVDEAIYRAYIKRRQLKNEAYMETWLIRILMNLCMSKYKKFKRQTGIEELPESATYADYENLPLKDAINRLPEQYRQLIILKYFGGYTVAEIGKMLEIPQGTVATRMRKALSLLRLDLS